MSRPSRDHEDQEIQITPEMVAAGVEALLLLEDDTFRGHALSSLEALVTEVFAAMAEAAPRR